MKAKLLLLLFLISTVGILAQSYPLYMVRDLQFVPDSSLRANIDRSPRTGDTVRVLGVANVRTVVDRNTDRRVIMWAGARWQNYLTDTSYASTEWNGINIIQDDTTVSSSNIEGMDTARIFIVTGVVQEFGRQTQINVIKSIPIVQVGTKNIRRTPVEVNISDFVTGTTPNILTGEKFEGAYVVIRNVISTDRNVGTNAANPFSIVDQFGNKIFVHGQSAYFSKRTYAVRAWDPPLDGSTIVMIRGVIGQNTDGTYVIRPMFPEDLIIGQSPPSISNVRRDLGLVGRNQAVTVTATIREINLGGTIAATSLRYRVGTGARQVINMTRVNDTTFSAVIPGVNADSALVDYFIQSTNALGLTATSPGDTVRNNFLYLVLNRPLTIQDVQFSPYGGGFSPYNNQRVTVTGIVTADTSDLQGDGNQVGRRTYIQNGNTPWSGIWVFGTTVDGLRRGQNVTISGLVMESSSNTRLDSITQVVINSSGNPLPTPRVISTRDISNLGNNALPAEQWESVLISYRTLRVINENADGSAGPGGGGNSNFGEIVVADTSNINTRVELQEGNHVYHNLWLAGLDTVRNNRRMRAGDRLDEMRGVLFYSFNNYKIVPRKDDDFIGYVPVSVKKDDLNQKSFALSQNYPNPFNPTTTIKYSIPTDGFVQVKIFNMLGQEVKSVVNLHQNAGEYQVLFDARDLTSGVYLYQIRVGNFVQTKKMMLLK